MNDHGILQHWKLMGAQAITILSHFINDNPNFGSVNGRGLPKKKIDLFCCDANIPPIEAVNLLLQAARSNILATDARFVLTLKNTCANHTEWSRAQKSCLDALSKRYVQWTRDVLDLEFVSLRKNLTEVHSASEVGESQENETEQESRSNSFSGENSCGLNSGLIAQEVISPPSATIEFVDFSFVHLLANTKNEGCISGTFRNVL
jgi:hypothetical protein